MSVAYYKSETLEIIARKTLCSLSPQYLNMNPQAVPIEKLIENVFGLSIDYQYLTESGDELGKMVYDSGYLACYNREKGDYELMTVKAGTMMIEASLLEDEKCYGRLRFTYAHELAHWLLHKEIYQGTGIAAAMYNEEQDEDATEWQANYLAQAILMPNGQIKRCFYSVHQQSAIDKKGIILEMSKIFEVSKQAMEIRLKHFGLIT